MAEVFFDRAARRVFGVFAEGAPVFGNVYGRMYLNLTGRASVARSLAWVLPRGAFERLLTKEWEEIWGSTPGDLGLPLIPVPPLATYLQLPRSGLLFLGALWRYYRGFRRFHSLSGAEVRGLRSALRDPGADAPSLAETWEARIQPRLVEAGTMVMLTAAAAAASQKQLSLSWPLLRYGRAGALSRIVAGVEGLASIAPVAELWQLSRLARAHPQVAELLRAPSRGAAGEPGWRARLVEVEGGEQFLRAFDTFLSHHGHRSDTEFEYSLPSWSEDPGPVVAALALQIELPDDEGPLSAQRARAVESQRELRKIHDKLGNRASRLAQGLVALHHGNMRRREEARDLLVLWASLGRDFVAAAGRALKATGLLSRAEDAVHLELGELLAALRGISAPPDPTRATPLEQVVAQRRHRIEFYRTLPDPPGVLRGLLLADDLTAGVRKAGIPGSLGRDRRGRTVIRGLPASPGCATGVVRVLDSPRESGLLRPGEVLVTRAANVGWTIIFQTVGAVVTDIGAPFSHAAIVTRELGRPAVVDTKVATLVLSSGDVVRADGNRGLVTRMLRRRGRRPFRPSPVRKMPAGRDPRSPLQRKPAGPVA
jgi:pyruvate,water dikinase